MYGAGQNKYGLLTHGDISVVRANTTDGSAGLGVPMASRIDP